MTPGAIESGETTGTLACVSPFSLWTCAPILSPGFRALDSILLAVPKIRGLAREAVLNSVKYLILLLLDQALRILADLNCTFA
jgi:hypothetical protein